MGPLLASLSSHTYLWCHIHFNIRKKSSKKRRLRILIKSHQSDIYRNVFFAFQRFSVFASLKAFLKILTLMMPLIEILSSVLKFHCCVKRKSSWWQSLSICFWAVFFEYFLPWENELLNGGSKGKSPGKT